MYLLVELGVLNGDYFDSDLLTMTQYFLNT